MPPAGMIRTKATATAIIIPITKEAIAKGKDCEAGFDHRQKRADNHIGACFRHKRQGGKEIIEH